MSIRVQKKHNNMCLLFLNHSLGISLMHKKWISDDGGGKKCYGKYNEKFDKMLGNRNLGKLKISLIFTSKNI